MLDRTKLVSDREEGALQRMELRRELRKSVASKQDYLNGGFTLLAAVWPAYNLVTSVMNDASAGRILVDAGFMALTLMIAFVQVAILPLHRRLDTVVKLLDEEARAQRD